MMKISFKKALTPQESHLVNHWPSLYYGPNQDLQIGLVVPIARLLKPLLNAMMVRLSDFSWILQLG